MDEDIQPTDQETMPLSLYTERAYLDYSMYVINDRALPHIGDEAQDRYNGESFTPWAS